MCIQYNTFICMWRVVGVVCSAVALSCNAAEHTIDLPGRLHLKTGRTKACIAFTLKKKKLAVRQTLDSGTILTEFYCIEDIETLEFPVPPFLSVAVTQDVSTVRLLKQALKAAEKEYCRWLPFAKIRGSWAAPIGYQYAVLLEKQKRYSTALTVYNRIYKQKYFRDTRRKSILRRAVCSYHCGKISNAYGLCTNAVETAENDRERAEAGYYCGVILTEFNRPAESLFILLKNTVFYHMHDSWEAKSLVASLRNYALLNDRERIESTCNILVEKFPDTSYSRCAMRWQEKCKTEMSPKEILAVIQLPLEK